MPGKQAPSFRVIGETRLRREGGEGDTPNDVHALTIDVGATIVAVTFKCFGGGKPETVESSSRDVRQHYQRVEEARQRTAYRNRKVKCELVEKPRSTPKAADAPKDGVGRSMVTCPACGAAGGITSCGYCEQSGWVTMGQAESWRDAHDSATLP